MRGETFILGEIPEKAQFFAFAGLWNFTYFCGKSPV